MKQEIKQKWIDALKSGEYQQGRERLKTKDGKYCCLGVLCDIYSKETGEGEWVKNKYGGFAFEIEEKNSKWELPRKVYQWAELDGDNPIFSSPDNKFGTSSLAEVNDAGVPFDKIAFIIQEKL